MKREPARSAVKQPGGCEERLAEGRARRKHLSRSKLGELDPRKRKTKALDVLLNATEGRESALLCQKYARMAVSPFAFFRGAVAIMAADLASQPSTRLTVQLCGDAHVQNLGSFEAPDGRVVFDINDFDETIAGPWEWDVKRMAASIVLAGAESEHTQGGCEEAVNAFACRYTTMIELLAEQPVLVAARHVIHQIEKAKAVSAALVQAERAKPVDLLKKYTTKDRRGQWQFKKIEHQLWRVSGSERRGVLDSLALYRQSLAPDRLHLFHFFSERDVAFKIVGTGSVGLRDYVVLMEGNGLKDPLFLQIKQEVRSAYAPYIKHLHYEHQGMRVAEGQRRIQTVSDLLLGWTKIGAFDFLVRQLNDHKGSIDLTKLRGRGLTSLAEVAGELLARGHARSGDALAIKGYIGSFEKIAKSIVDYGMKYAQLTTEDFADFKKAIKNGQIKAAS